jgi:hypothetical protein
MRAAAVAGTAVDVQFHETTLDRFDHKLLVNTHVCGWNAFATQVLPPPGHRRRPALLDLPAVLKSVWEQSVPAPSTQ